MQNYSKNQVGANEHFACGNLQITAFLQFPKLESEINLKSSIAS